MSHPFQALAEHLRRFGRPVLVLDLETTGGDFYRDRITEIAFLHFDRGQIRAVQHLVNPQRRIEPFVEQLTGLSDAMLEVQPVFADILPHILPLLRGSLLIAHNSRFDYTFLRHECRRAGVPFAAPALCSVQLSRKLYPEHYKHSLESIIERHGIAVGGRHRAMADVQALAAFLQTALAERGAGAWQWHAESLLNPLPLPEKLPNGLRRQTESLHDGHGVSVFYDSRGGILALHGHSRAYTELAQLLRRQPDHSLFQAASLRFHDTVGGLHSCFVRACLMAEHRLAPQENSTGCYGIRFSADGKTGSLKARVVPLQAGFHTEPPHGLFRHPKAAKRALAAWAGAHNICPTLLGILADPPPAGGACPVSLLRPCSAACRSGDTALHNQSTAAALRSLPAGEWGAVPSVRIRETDPVTGRSETFVCRHGALLLPDGHWYTDSTLLAVLKDKFKKTRQDIEPLVEKAA